MKKVFIGGSRRISKLNDQIRSKLAEIVDRELEILIGDANGADRAVQAQLAAWKYPRVSVYFVGPKPRNNVGCWPLLHVETPKGLKGFDFFSAKDKRMAREADCGLMLWDGEPLTSPKYYTRDCRSTCPIRLQESADVGLRDLAPETHA